MAFSCCSSSRILRSVCISVVDPDPYWISIQKLCESGSVLPIRIRIPTCKYRIKYSKGKRCKLRHHFTIQRLNWIKRLRCHYFLIFKKNLLFKENCSSLKKLLIIFFFKIDNITLVPASDPNWVTIRIQIQCIWSFGSTTLVSTLLTGAAFYVSSQGFSNPLTPELDLGIQGPE